GDSIFVGTPKNLLAVDSDGNVIETSLASSVSASNGLTASSNEVKLGGTLTQNTTISNDDLYRVDISGIYNATAGFEGMFNVISGGTTPQGGLFKAEGSSTAV